MVTTPSSMIIEAEALSERDKEKVAAGYQQQAKNQRLNELQKERFDAIGRGEIPVESSINMATGSQVTYQSSQYINYKDTLNYTFLPITNLFDRIPDFLKVDPVLIGFFVAIFITSIYIGRQFSHKKRIARRNRRDWRRKLKELIAQNTWRHRSNDEPGILRVTPEEYRRMQEFERSFVTVGKSDPEYFLHVTSGAKLIDASRRGNELYSIDTIIHGRSLRILKYRDPSTKVQDPSTGEWVGQLYISFVPEHINKADHGMAWKFRLTPGEYRRTKRHEA